MKNAEIKSVEAGDKGRLDLSILTVYLAHLFRYARLKAALCLALMIFLGLTQGMGLMMLIPFLDLIGIGGGEGDGGRLAAFVGKAMGALGLPLTLPVILAFFVGLVTLYALAKRWKDVLVAEISHGFTRFLQEGLYESLSRVEWLCFIRTRNADLTRTLTSDVHRVGFGTQQLLHLISATMLAIVHILIALGVSAPMTGAALGSGALLLAILRPFNQQAHQAGVKLQTTVGDMYAAVSEYLNGMKVAKSYGIAQKHVQHFTETAAEMAGQFVRFARVNAAARTYFEIGGAAALGFFFYGAVAVAKMPTADLLLIVFLFARLLPTFSLMQQTWQRVINTLPSYKMVLSLEETLSTEKETPPTLSAARLTHLEKGVELRRVSFRYDKNRKPWALNNVDLVIPAGSMTAVVGPSGSGKSTLADVVMGLLSPDEGDVLIDDRPLNGPHLHAWRRSVGYVPQDTFLFHDTVKANLLWIREDAAEEELWQALAAAAADDFVRALPQGLDTVVGDRGVRLSGGERQRIALARSLLRRPALLLLDEATSNLDHENEQRIQQAVERLHGELTILVVAHRLSTIKNADQLIVLSSGGVAESGTWDELADKIGNGRNDLTY